jgi:serine/threonine protein kinase
MQKTRRHRRPRRRRESLAVLRRLRGSSALPPFLGVAGADAFLVFKDVGVTTLASALASAKRGAPYASLARALGLGDEQGEGADLAAVRAFGARLFASLDALHGAGVVHRDVKPANLLLSDGKRVLLLDLGAAADLAAKAAEDILTARLAGQAKDPLLNAAIAEIGDRLN